MTREELTEKFLPSKSKNYILMLPTGYGKTLFSLKKAMQWVTPHSSERILIVIPRLININEWVKEIKKWKFEELLDNITFTTYVSLPKHCSPNNHWNTIIFDEGHHTSERCQEALQFVSVSHIIVLSATLKRDLVHYFNIKFHPEVFHIKVKDAIENDVLPDPKLILIPLTFNNTVVNQVIEKNVKKNNTAPIKTIGYIEKWKYRSYKGPLHILCTQQQYYDDLCNLIEWYKQKGMYNAVMHNMWLHKAGERLKWLAEQKENLVKDLLKTLSNYRTLVFCPSIEDSGKIGSPCINSKVGTENLTKFNEKKIKHIAAVGMLDEGANLVDCKVGIFQMINSSDRLNIQRQGRLLRHKTPVLIFPYFIHSREQEIINDIIKDYNPELVVKLDINDLKNIKKYI